MTCKILIDNSQNYVATLTTGGDDPQPISGASLTALVQDRRKETVDGSSVSLQEDGDQAGTYRGAKPHDLALKQDAQYRVKVSGTYQMDGQTKHVTGYSEWLRAAELIARKDGDC